MKRRKQADSVRLISLVDVVAEELLDPEFRAVYEAERLRREAALTLVRLRKGAKLSQARLAALVGVPQSVVARFESARETGSVTLTTLTRMFAPFGLVSISITPKSAAGSRARAIAAVSRVRARARETGRDKLSLAEINREIQAVRRRRRERTPIS